MDEDTVFIIVGMIEDRIRKLNEIIHKSTNDDETKHYKSARHELRVTRFSILKSYDKDIKVKLKDV